MNRKILLPTDFSENAWNAISYAIDLYKNEKCEFYILNVYTVTGFTSDTMLAPEFGEIAYKNAKNASEKELDKVLFKLSFKDENPNHDYFTISKSNSLINSINEVIEEKKIDIIVMGTKGVTNATDIIFGSNTVMIMEKIRNCPVLAIPSEVKFSKPKEIVFPTSYHTHYKRRELKYLIEIAIINRAAIRILHVGEEKNLNEKQNKNKELLEEYFEDLEYSFHIIYGVEIQTALDCFVQSRDSDMIAFINKKHGFIDNIFTNHLVQELGHNSKVPVLTLHNL